ncbi:MAG: hypothetical protein IT458_00180 [Planctomycetes bacterium]|nr:hypothetical protein [Planctomycetota bacterium]
MQELLRWLALRKGIPLEDGTELRLELAAIPGGGLALVLLVGLVGALWLIAAIYRRETREFSLSRRLVLIGLRAVAILVALAVFLEPSLIAVKRDVRKGHLIVLVDRSQSMASKDPFRRAESGPYAEGWREVGIAAPGAASRLDLARAALFGDGGRLLRELAQKNELRLYGFGGGIEPIAADADPATLPADGRSTDLGAALRGALERSRDAGVAGLVLLSDGRRNQGAPGAEAARVLVQRKVPRTLVLPVGDPAQTESLALGRIEAPEKVFQRDPFRVRAQVLAQGLDAPVARAKLVEVAKDGTTRAVETKEVTLAQGRGEAWFEFAELSAEDPGTRTYAVELEPLGGETFVPERHRRETRLDVLADQIRVLLVAGSPKFEFRTLQTFLIRDRTVQVSGYLQSADPDFPQDGDVPIQALPGDKAAIGEYHAFVFLDPDPRRLGREFCQEVARQVSEEGAGLWWVCGEKHTLEALRDTASTEPLAAILPVVPDLALADREVVGFGRAFDAAWPFTLTPEGSLHPLTRLVADKDENALLWPRLPRFHWAFPVARPKPAALTLVAHPNPRLARSDGPMPLLAAHFVGAGRVLFAATDEVYRWVGPHEGEYQRYWLRGLRWLFEGKLGLGGGAVRLRLAEERIELGEGTQLGAEARDPAGQPIVLPSLRVRIGLEGGSEEELDVPAVEGAPGRYATFVRPPATGFHRVRHVDAQGKESTARLQVVPARLEREGPVDLAELSALCTAPGAQLLTTAAQLRAELAKLPSATTIDVFRTPHALWDGMVTVLLLLSVLAAEWLLRKRFNLL